MLQDPAPSRLHAPGGGEGPALPVFVLLVVAALAAAVVRQGAYYPDGQRLVGPLLGAAVVAVLVARRRRAHAERSRTSWWAAALAGWAMVSGAVAGDVGGALAPMALLGAVVAVLAVCRRATPTEREALAGAAVAIGVLAALAGWVGVAWRIRPLALEDQALWRAASTLTYANATAALLVPLALVSLAWSAARPGRWAPAAATSILLVGTAATLSRGGAVALVVGLAALAVLLGPAAVIRAAFAPAVGAALAFAGLVPSMPAGSPPRPGLALVALLVGLAFTVVAPRWGLTGVFVVIAAAGVLVAGPAPGAWSQISGPRLTVSSPDRADETSAALRLVGDHPVTGTGPGRATLAWTGPDGRTMVARYVHNEYLQVLAELGVVGLALLGGLLVSAARLVRRGRPTAGRPHLWAGAAAGLVALAVHSSFDFLWHLAALPLLAALLTAISSPVTTEDQP